MAIAPGGLLTVNSFSVAPVAEAANFGFRLRGNAQAIATAVAEAGATTADRQRSAADSNVNSPALVAFDSEARLVETLLNTGTMLDVFV